MKQVSEAYKESMASPLRNRSYVKIIIYNSNGAGQIEFTNSDIVSTKQSHDVDPLSRRLPKETLQFTILDFEHRYDPDNPSGVWKDVENRAKVSIQFGYELPSGIEWVKPDIYYLTGMPEFANNRTTFKATGLLGIMDGTYYKGKYGYKTFYSVAEDVLLDAGLPLLPDGGNPWVIDDSLNQMYTTGALPITTHANCLQMIAHACRCKLYTDDDNIIHIEPFTVTQATPATSDFCIGNDSISQGGQSRSNIDQLKAVTVERYYASTNHLDNGDGTLSAEYVTLYRGLSSDTAMHLEFSRPSEYMEIKVDYGTIVSSSTYARAVDMVLSAGEKIITVKGSNTSEMSVSYTHDVNETGAIDTEKNVLITDRAMAVALADHVAQYLQLRNTYDVSYRGNPELECGDIIGLETMHAGRIIGLVLTDEITYNGTLRGKVKVKVLSVQFGAESAVLAWGQLGKIELG